MPMPLSLLEWKAFPRNSLRGFATIRLGKSLKISDVAVHCAYGKRWAQLPSKPALDKDGAAQRDEKGKIKYIPVIAWLNREAADDFSASVIDAIEREHPGATNVDAA
jgi:hypothetical protein